MKANSGKGNNEERDIWQTPKELFEKLDQQYCFSFDCCASKDNSKCVLWSEDFLSIYAKIEKAWMNPPFSKALEMFKHFFEVIVSGVAIYRCDNLETAVWQGIILENADWIFIPNKRIQYEGLNGGGSRFASALIGKGLNPPENLDGKILFLKRGKDRDEMAVG